MRALSTALTVLFVLAQWVPVLRGWPVCARVVRALQLAGGELARRWPRTGPITRTVIPAFWQGLPVVLILSGPAVLPALAYASPPDPLWIPGIYDDADYDDVVVLAASGTGDIAPVPPVHLRPSPLLTARLSEFDEKATVVHSLSAVLPRAPPPQ
ncbi:MAG TPA: hypothetical protein VEL75_00885 [Candidatus Methylomirabilis sp.]|nr:hypothetical protein [Candidatus Methylomirabilis sp.]